MADKEVPIEKIPLVTRAQLLRGAYERLTTLLAIHCEGMLLVLSDAAEEAYQKLLQICGDIVTTAGFEDLASRYPQSLPRSLHSMGEEADSEWEYIRGEIHAFTGDIVRHSVEASAPRNPELEKVFFETHDRSIRAFTELKVTQEKKFLSKAATAASKEGGPAASSADHLFPPAIVKGTRGYVVSVVDQINGCYRNGWYDACAVMIRRLYETLIVDCFEAHGIAEQIKDTHGNFLPFDQLIPRFVSQPAWNLGRQTRKDLSSIHKAKLIGDLSAHGRRHIAQRKDIGDVAIQLGAILQELVDIAYRSSQVTRGSPTLPDHLL